MLDGGGLRGRARQLQPGDDHDRPRGGDDDLHRAAAARTGRPGDRARAARRAAADARRPDGAQPRQGAARGRHAGALRRRADRRRLRGDRPRRGPRALPRDDDRRRPARAAQRDRPHASRSPRRACAEIGLPFIVRPAFTLGGTGGGVVRTTRPSSSGSSAAGSTRLADRPGPARGVGARLGRVRARGDARPRRQRRDRLLDREPRPDGRAHRRQRLRGASADAHRQAVPGAARPGDRGDPRRRGRDRRLQRAVRRQPARPTRSS